MVTAEENKRREEERDDNGLCLVEFCGYSYVVV